MTYELLENYVKNGKNVFLTGPAGTGKTFNISRLSDIYPEMVLTSTTGISAIAIGGTTIHSFSGIGVPRARDTIEYIVKKVKKGLSKEGIINCEKLVVDEISMLGATTLDLLNEVFKQVRGINKAFGGIQVIFTGDMLQLPPINDNYCFKSETWKELNLEIIYLTKLYRFVDEKYSDILIRIRTSEHTYEDNKELFKRFFAYKDTVDNEDIFDKMEIKPTYLYSKRVDVSDKNLEELDKLKTELFKYDAEDTIKKKIKEQYTQADKEKINLHLDLLAPKNILLKEGAQVMLTINENLALGLANGSRGVITKLSKDMVEVKFLDEITQTFAMHDFEYEEQGQVIATRKQFPFILAWACSIHKIQGATLDCAIINLGQSIFEASQAYVALSRVRSLSGLYLEAYKPAKIFCNKEALEFYQNLYRN
jgi:ATP-dependent DNA helicase PIF1